MGNRSLLYSSFPLAAGYKRMTPFCYMLSTHCFDPVLFHDLSVNVRWGHIFGHKNCIMVCASVQDHFSRIQSRVVKSFVSSSDATKDSPCRGVLSPHVRKVWRNLESGMQA
ncbi:hypothetical protein TNCV_4772231 [Trichonephila clavipes]|nr:hypothetical protein TNCV_4772231 [Trichonephila clavipes]